MRIHRIGALAVLVPSLAAVACASWRGGIEKPGVSLTKVDTARIGVFEQELDVGLRFHNPNDFPLDVHGIRFAIEIDGDPVARGRDDERFTIPPDGEREVAVKARAQSVAMVRQLMNADDLAYQVDGTLLLDNAEAKQVDFKDKTSLDLD